MEKGEQKGRQKEWKSPGGGAGEKSQDKLLRIFGQEGVLQEWAKKQGITLIFGQLEVFPEETIKESAEEVTPAETMGLKLKEL